MGKHRKSPWAEREHRVRELMEQFDVLDYEAIRHIASESGIPVEHLLVQGDSNDPMYAGRPQPTKDAQWFADFYHQQGWEDLHIRGCHYQLASLRVRMPNGEMYENDLDSYGWLGNVAKTARYLHLIPLDEFKDRRNDDFVDYSPIDAKPGIRVTDSFSYMFDLELPDFPDLPGYTLDYRNAKNSLLSDDVRYLQRYRLEIWIEKSSMNDIIRPICKEYDIGFQSAMGEMSLYRVHQLVQRIKRDKRPCRIFYISDFDKSGNNMPVAMGNKFNWCLEEERMTGRDIKLFHIALTEKQVNQYQLPRAPQKKTVKITEKFVDGAVELDALQALHRGELRKIITSALDPYYDDDFIAAAEEVKKELQTELKIIEQEVLDEYKDEIDKVRGEYDGIVNDMQGRMDEYKDHVLSLYDKVGQKMNKKMPDIADYPIPECRVVEDEPEPLYDSTWKRYDRIVAFKKHQGKYIGDDAMREDEERQEREEQEQQEHIEKSMTLADIEKKLQEIAALYPTFKLPKNEKRVVGELLIRAKECMPLKDYRPWCEKHVPKSQPMLSRWRDMARNETNI